MPRAQSADGVIHDFPDGTDPDVIDRVMKSYAMQHAPQPRETSTPISPLAGYLQGSWEGVKQAGRDTVQAGKDVGSALMGGDPHAALQDVGAAAMFMSGGLTSPIGPQRSGPLARADRTTPPPAKSVTVDEFLEQAGKKGGDQKDGAASMSVAEMAHLLHAVLRHDPMAIARILGTKYLSGRE